MSYRGRGNWDTLCWEPNATNGSVSFFSSEMVYFRWILFPVDIRLWGRSLVFWCCIPCDRCDVCRAVTHSFLRSWLTLLFQSKKQQQRAHTKRALNQWIAHTWCCFDRLCFVSLQLMLQPPFFSFSFLNNQYFKQWWQLAFSVWFILACFHFELAKVS